ncbi:hypothetical protein CR513_54970, partial [Mucuna pruriens]
MYKLLNYVRTFTIHKQRCFRRPLSSKEIEIVRRHDRPRDETKKNPWNLIKGEIRHFSSKGDPNDYYDWELKVEQNLDSLHCKDLIKVKLISLSFEDYALILWNEIAV